MRLFLAVLRKHGVEAGPRPTLSPDLQAASFTLLTLSAFVLPGARRPQAYTSTAVFDWSTSYQAGSSRHSSSSSPCLRSNIFFSSSASRSSSDEETEEEFPPAFRGRTFSHTKNAIEKKPLPIRQSSSHRNSSGDSASTVVPHGRSTFTRSRSPAVVRSSLSSKIAPTAHRLLSPTRSRLARPKSPLPEPVVVLPADVQLRVPIPFTNFSWGLVLYVQRFGEAIILLSSLLFAISRFSDLPPYNHLGLSIVDINKWISSELCFLGAIAFAYLLWTHSTLLSDRSIVSDKTADFVPGTPPPSSNGQARPASPRVFEVRDTKRYVSQAYRQFKVSYMWMSVPKNYRDLGDDGIMTGLLLAPLISSALLFVAQRSSSEQALLPGWLIEEPATLPNSPAALSAAEALVFSRYNLVNLATYCSFILLVHVCASRWFENRYGKFSSAPEGERTSVPRSELRRTWYYVAFVFALTVFNYGLKAVLHHYGLRFWQHLSNFDFLVVSLFYQFALYVALRMAHRGFTLGELSLVCFGGVAVGMEVLNITIARIRPKTTPFIKTYRLPTPLLTFQTALIAGPLLTGFLLSPFLVLSRHNAQRPLHRLKFPQEKERNRRRYAFAFYIGSALIVGGLIGSWTWWCLGRRNPWTWALFYVGHGKKKWSRPTLLAYWAFVGSLSVAGWSRQLARSRKYRTRTTTNEIFTAMVVPDVTNSHVSLLADPPVISPSATTSTTSHTGSSGAPINGGTLGMTFGSLPMPNLPNGTNVSNVATDWLDAADKHVPTLGLNARRKFFHALAVVMFIPGVASDPAFVHLSFSVAFAVFVFAEYIRYFAIYPFGAAVHVFMNDFLDQKDSGTAILSHFYLLTGCAGSIWLESPTQLLQYTGIFALGVGDALASIVGKRIGTHRWCPTTSKTVEGSVAFTVSVVGCAWLMRVLGYAERFSTAKYVGVVWVSGLLEALSEQNDNLTLPLYMWSMLVAVAVE
ncbi:hypothetical protein AX15_005841 [Amanita polypyramis BW_CC]|nr:hypothetical protein AX15_005841 [Amanita polypyramis BW_CC]